MQRLDESKNILEFILPIEMVEQSLESITIGIEDIFIAEIIGSKFSDEEIAMYAKQISIGVLRGIRGYLKENHSIDATNIDKVIRDNVSN